MTIELLKGKEYNFICPDGELYNGSRINGELVFIGSKNTVISSYKNNPFEPAISNSGYRYFKGIRFDKLVAYAYGLIDDINDKTYTIGFKDCDRTNCRLDNLIINHFSKENNKALKNGRIACYNYNTGEFVKLYKSMMDASRDLNIPWANVKAVLTGQYNKTHGYYFKWLDKDEWSKLI